MKDIDTRLKLSFFSIFIFLDRIVLVEKDFFFRFSLELISFSVALALLIKFLKVIENLSSNLIIDLIVKDLGSNLIIDLIVEDLRILSLEDLMISSLEASKASSSEDLILDSVSLL